MKLAIIVPVYNEAQVIKSVINSLNRKIKGIDETVVLAINDGSDDDSVLEISKTKAKIINLPINLGYGAANITGLEAAKKLKADIAVSFDGDGQHDPRDIANLIRPIIEKKADLVIGSRFSETRLSDVPYLKKIGIKGLNFIIFLLSGHWASDSQCGLKAFSSKAISRLKLSSIGMEFASEIIMVAKKEKLKIVEVPIKIIYTTYSRRKGQSIFNGLNIVTKLLINKIAR